ncbi:aldehyde dehydrogenase family protein [Nocardia sp. NPDC050697]|uniref:aldehyde dehydrogenase family protein n=1 Tax=Nocardia sp. NPDC050697 TaxID=3155158 RepID=UPI0033C7627C
MNLPLTESEPDAARTGARELLELQQAAFLCEGPPTAAVRRERIDRLTAMVLDNADAYVEALVADYGTRSPTGIRFAEIVGMLSVLEHTRSHVRSWMRSRNPSPAARLMGIRAEVQPTPLGVVGIVGPWNFPLNLVILPAAAAFAAGNRVMIKMSEVTARTAELTARLAAEYFDPAELAVVTGGPDVAAAFTALPFDHLFFTGSPRIGQLVARAAAENLVPVTLELGGKNPVVVGRAADIGRAARRIARARMVNGGQVCVCPDYVFVPEEHFAEFTGALRTELRTLYPAIQDDADYTASVDRANYDRVVGLIEDARTRGAEVESLAPPHEPAADPVTRKIAPTLITGVTDDMRVAREEVFGPVLALRPYRELAEVTGHVAAGHSPLVAYWFGPDDADFRTFVRNTRSGGVARNDFAIHMFPSDAPFGGVGHSGMGAYHGKAGFDTFSHHRTVVGSALPFPVTALAAPPFTPFLRNGVGLALRAAAFRARRRLGR